MSKMTEKIQKIDPKDLNVYWGKLTKKDLKSIKAYISKDFGGQSTEIYEFLVNHRAITLPESYFYLRNVEGKVTPWHSPKEVTKIIRDGIEVGEMILIGDKKVFSM